MGHCHPWRAPAAGAILTEEKPAEAAAASCDVTIAATKNAAVVVVLAAYVLRCAQGAASPAMIWGSRQYATAPSMHRCLPHTAASAARLAARFGFSNANTRPYSGGSPSRASQGLLRNDLSALQQGGGGTHNAHITPEKERLICDEPCSIATNSTRH